MGGDRRGQSQLRSHWQYPQPDPRSEQQHFTELLILLPNVPETTLLGAKFEINKTVTIFKN